MEEESTAVLSWETNYRLGGRKGGVPRHSLKRNKSLPALAFPEAKEYIGEWKETAVCAKE